MDQPTKQAMDPATAALSSACGGDVYFWSRDNDARIIRRLSPETNVLVTAQVTCAEEAPDALRAVLVEIAPFIAKRHRSEAAEKREEARVLLAEASALEDAATAIDAALFALAVFADGGMMT